MYEYDNNPEGIIHVDRSCAPSRSSWGLLGEALTHWLEVSDAVMVSLNSICKADIPTSSIPTRHVLIAI